MEFRLLKRKCGFTCAFSARNSASRARTLAFEPSGFQPPDVMRALMVALMSGVGSADQVKVLSPAALWGLVASKDANDDQPGRCFAHVHFVVP